MTDQISVLMGVSSKMSLAAAQTEEAGSTIVQLTGEEIRALRTGLRLLMAAMPKGTGERIATAPEGLRNDGTGEGDDGKG